MSQRYAWQDFEPDEADSIPDKEILTITDDGEELCVIVHRKLAYEPLNDTIKAEKRTAARRIVAALNHWEEDC